MSETWSYYVITVMNTARLNALNFCNFMFDPKPHVSTWEASDQKEGISLKETKVKEGANFSALVF